MPVQRRFSALSLLFMAIGGMVGSGWLFGPLYAAQFAGPSAFIAWVVGGVLMMIIALTFSELAAMLPFSGAMARFVQFSHGSFSSFTLTWVAWLAAVVVAPIETMAMLQYASTYIPWLMQADPSGVGHTLTAQGGVVAAIVMLIMCYVNTLGAKVFSKTNNTVIIWKLAIPVITIIVLLTARFHPQNFVSHGFFAGGIKGLLHALPEAGVIFSFIGYSPAIQLAGEAKNPQRAIPWSVLGAIFFCIVMFVLLQIAFVAAIPGSSIANGWHALSFSDDAGPVAGLLTMLGFLGFVKLLYIDAVISPLGTGFIYTASTARLNYAMSQNGYMPKFLQALNKQHMPHKAIWLNFAVGMVFFAPFPGWQKMVSFLVSCFVLSYAIGPIALVTLRTKLPNQHRPFRLPCAALLSFLAFYICNLIVYWTGWPVISKMLLVIGIGYVVLLVSNRGVLKGFDFRHGVWLLFYLAGLGLISYFGAFSGRNVLTFGWDFLVIALFSLAIFIWAYASRSGPIDPAELAVLED
ncbi:MAG: amino acid permease [Gammaproteobacteria bacterium CG11_big_fil_rev_8_21_14_0_20_46_22]|nr:MAG: amino acid permease [Gammaproteobacteria bacterium CG12_big_fil_rev_8_21_14_0_65_46_12]PIR11455.1 MAG: amino acid permease [Gammaproteobacteria bacterium CG11_big_fil_rev_8_21_14_0_20_46_22]